MKQIFTVPEAENGSGGNIRFAWQNNTAVYLAVARIGGNSVNIFDRHGSAIEEIGLPAQCTGFSWDKDGDVLAVVTNRSNVIILWDANTRKTTAVDSSMSAKDALTFVTWAKTSLILAVGNSKGNLLLYDHRSQRKVPIIGKHTKAIISGAFSDKNLLALGSEDSTITISSHDGDTLHSFICASEPHDIQFAEMKETDRMVASGGDTTISALVGEKVLMLINLNDAANPVNLQFQPKYGNIAQYSWFGDGYILIGFQLGYLVCLSTHASEIGQEVFSVQDHKAYISGLCVNASFGKALTVGDSGVKVRELNQLSEVYAILTIENADRGLDKVSTTEDGQLMAVSTATGAVHVFLTKLPVLGDSFRTKIAYLSSLTEVTVSDETEQEKPLTFDIDTEPSFVAVAVSHVAVGMNNRAWYYHCTEEGAEFIRDKEYLGTVQTLKLNADYACALFEGKLHLHQIDPQLGNNNDPQAERDNRLFPDPDKSNARITCMALAMEFLVFGTDAGHIQYFFLEDWKMINEYRHVTGIRAVYPEPNGTRLIFIDSKIDSFVYNPVNDSMMLITDSSGSVKGILWDNYSLDKDSFIIYDNTKVLSYIHYRDTIEGPKVEQVGVTKLPHGFSPLVLHNGQLTCQTQNGRTNQIALSTHKLEESFQGKSKGELDEVLRKYIKMKRWLNAWNVCEALGTKESWRNFAIEAMKHMDVDYALRAFRQLGDIGMVWSMERLKNVENRNLLAGDLAMYLDQVDLAEKLYLESTRPIAALEMRRDLLHWEKALQLSNRLAPDQVSYISKEYAQQLEFLADYTNALTHYEKGILSSEEEKAQEHNQTCNAGVARMSIRLGDIRRGLRIATESPSRLLKKECAQILESMKQYNEAATLYEKGHFIDKAAAVYARSKNWLKVGELLPNVHSPKIHSQYAKAMEFEGKFKLAVEAYKNAKDYDNVVRILLDKLNLPEEAVRVVRESKSVEGAKLVAKFFLKLNDYTSAIQFLVLSHCHQEAYKLAELHDKMEVYADVIGDDAPTEDYAVIAQYFEANKKAFYAGKFFVKSGQYAKALTHLISNGEDHESLKLAIDCTAQANDSELTRRLIDFLIGEIDGIPKMDITLFKPKDAKYLFRLYMALKMYREAAKTAVIIAGEEQLKGQYRLSHDVLFGMCQELAKQKLKIPAEMTTNLMILHSYVLIKIHIKRSDHIAAARMLIRVVGNISKFPAHIIQILTSAVIECHRSGLRNSAFKFAAMLMRPEYRSRIDEKYKKKIEGIVRKPDKTEIDEPTSPCLHCGCQLAETELTCSDCKSALPYCIATGKHLTKNNFTVCPACHFPALYAEFRKLIEQGFACPMCSSHVEASAVVKLNDEEMNQFFDATNSSDNHAD